MTAPSAPSLRAEPTASGRPRGPEPARPHNPRPGRPAGPSAPPRRAVARLVVLGDSAAVGIGDPVDGGWRGFPVLLHDALGPGCVLDNRARSGARMGCVVREQLPAAIDAAARDAAALTPAARTPAALTPAALTPAGAALVDVAVVCAGMNDTLRADFDPVAVEADCAATISALRASGALVVVMRYHDHTRVFRLPAPLRRALHARITALNTAIDAAAQRAGAAVLDLGELPGRYDTSAWAVDRLHPSELGHRTLAAAITAIVAGTYDVAGPVSLTCAGGRRVTAAHRVAWLVVKGVPWLVRRGRGLGPVILTGLVDGLRAGRDAGPRVRDAAAPVHGAPVHELPAGPEAVEVRAAG
ncbi:SGNH hydrolase [Pseudonocardia sulfidoxydans NBRC 16205]|uniref:SGNH hydrolase n=1 Tax=Pseudonocardia sulfidoxydans NBRC 16205 TaxID=1223511 RepID=A0A511DGU6_9PSEU|nr:SGNH/GDSL hydrolase family protein [Pseudonocardia sulfidoxydans]GEL24010.1 SGNH hydrolase [Pseudonocardia sulfidoxydans NBRC 16205]